MFVAIQFFGCAPVKYKIPESEPKYLRLGEEEQVQVLAAGDWRSSGVKVRKGEKYRITAKGRWQISGLCNWCGADGGGIYHAFCWNLGGQIVPGFTHGALIAKIGKEGLPFGVGDLFLLKSNIDGILHFRINDNVLGDNIGLVMISVKNVSKP
jgi:hypothetical protein